MRAPWLLVFAVAELIGACAIPTALARTVNDNTLTLAPAGGHDACGIRGFIWAGQWTRTS